MQRELLAPPPLGIKGLLLLLSLLLIVKPCDFWWPCLTYKGQLIHCRPLVTNLVANLLSWEMLHVSSAVCPNGRMSRWFAKFESLKNPKSRLNVTLGHWKWQPDWACMVSFYYTILYMALLTLLGQSAGYPAVQLCSSGRRVVYPAECW